MWRGCGQRMPRQKIDHQLSHGWMGFQLITVSRALYEAELRTRYPVSEKVGVRHGNLRIVCPVHNEDRRSDRRQFVPCFVAFRG